MRWLAFPAAVAIALGAVLISAPAALATPQAPPVDLGGAYWVDQTGVLSDDAGEVDQALSQLSADTDLDLFVVVVSSFDDEDPQDWANESAEMSGLGTNDILLAIAVDDRVYRWSVEQDFPLSDSQLSSIATNDLEPKLAADDWAGGIAAFAKGLAGTANPTIPIVPILIVLGIIALTIILIVIIVRSRARARRNRQLETERMTQKELETRAGTLLVAIDDSLKTSEQELGFATAEFGEAATTQFSAALESARKKVSDAFELRRNLDDAKNEGVEEKRAMALKIIELCESADAELDAQADAFNELRKLEQTAPQVIETVAATLQTQPARITAAETTVTTLRSRFGAASVLAIEGNVDQARKLDDFAGEALTRAREELAAGKGGAAAMSVRGAQQSVGQVDQLLAAIDAASVDVPKLADRLAATLADTRADAAEARALPATPGVDQNSLRTLADEADRTVAAAEGAELRAALTSVDEVNARLNEELGRVRGHQQQIDRATAALPSLLEEARRSVIAAQSFITSRRGGVSESPRARLVEADRLVAKAAAGSATDPMQAYADAKQADALADTALQSAQSEAYAFQNSGYGQSYGQPSSGGGFGSNMGGAILGGILGGLLSGGGGGRGGGWSGGSSGGSGGWGGGGGFGGSSQHGGGSSGGGGRRGGGGRF